MSFNTAKRSPHLAHVSASGQYLRKWRRKMERAGWRSGTATSSRLRVLVGGKLKVLDGEFRFPSKGGLT